MSQRRACSAQANDGHCDGAGDQVTGEHHMRLYRITFFGGLAIGYVLGAQAGRERYEQNSDAPRRCHLLWIGGAAEAERSDACNEDEERESREPSDH